MNLKIRGHEGIAASFVFVTESFEADSLALEDVEISEIMGEFNSLIRGSDLKPGLEPLLGDWVLGFRYKGSAFPGLLKSLLQIIWILFLQFSECVTIHLPP